MPILRKLTSIGSSKGITLPKSWIAHAEEESCSKITALALEIGDEIRIIPIFTKQNRGDSSE
jgi:hypothetical protein